MSSAFVIASLPPSGVAGPQSLYRSAADLVVGGGGSLHCSLPRGGTNSKQQKQQQASGLNRESVLAI